MDCTTALDPALLTSQWLQFSLQVPIQSSFWRSKFETGFDPYRTYLTSKTLQKAKLLLVSSGTSSKCRLALSSIEEMLQWELCCYLPIYMMICSCPSSLYHSGKYFNPIHRFLLHHLKLEMLFPSVDV